MKIINLSNSERCRAAEEILETYDARSVEVGRVLLLPIPSFRDGEHISGTDTQKGELLSMLMPRDLLVGYKIPEELCSHARSVGCRILDLEADGGFIAKNNSLTADATVGYILSAGGEDISELSVGIIGYGGLGSALLRLLLFLGARVTVFSGSIEKREALAREGVASLGYEEIASEKLDILINTAPKTLLCQSISPTVLLDLASGNRYSHLGAKFLPSLPEKYYPKSAGRAYAKAVIDYCNLH